MDLALRLMDLALRLMAADRLQCWLLKLEVAVAVFQNKTTLMFAAQSTPFMRSFSVACHAAG